MNSTDSTAQPTSPDSHKTKKPQKSARRRAREFTLQGIYQWLVSDNDPGAIDAQIRGMDGFKKSDAAHYDALLHGIIADASAIDAVLAPHVDRKTTDLSPIEHAILMLGAYELQHCLDIPYRVVINEAVELAKTYGGTDGFKYVNGVLDKVAAHLRPAEVQG
ncbi:transcription antitermination factor NusB [Saezia sanguinis]|uniref:transcription antitermination factor NusB n=1 Tax=Saezia sanguinis TaxID=1965230 RepID=UPI003045391A